MLRKRIQMSSDGRVGKYRIDSMIEYFNTSSDYGETWNRVDATYTHGHVAPPAVFSETGQYQMVSAGFCGFYYSSDYGKTWSSVNTKYLVVKLYISSDGKFQFCADGMNMYKSYDYGNTWTDTAFHIVWRNDLGISSSGRYWINNSIGVNVSSDYGKTWVRVVGLDGETNSNVFISGSGKCMIYMSAKKDVFESFDYGKTWERKSITTIRNYMSLSATGRYQVTVEYINGDMYIGNSINNSSDYGNTWTTTAIPGLYINQIYMSSTGRKQIFNGTFNHIKTTGTSLNYGKTWTLGDGKPSDYCTGIFSLNGFN